jgi:hypothetical protein
VAHAPFGCWWGLIILSDLRPGSDKNRGRSPDGERPCQAELGAGASRSRCGKRVSAFSNQGVGIWALTSGDGALSRPLISILVIT